MNVSLSLDDAREHYTNFDLLQGKVFLRVPNPTSITSIIVKLEGEAKTRLLTPLHPTRPIHVNRPERQRPVLEFHKFLYQTQMLWPANVHQEDLASNPRASFTIDAGQYVYPFQFKIPLNTYCQQPNGSIPSVSFVNSIPEFAQTPTKHVKAQLPPSWSGLPGEAEIKYFVKVTVRRPQLFKENLRAINLFAFLPIEPPRAEQDGERFASLKHEFLEEVSRKAIDKDVEAKNLKSSLTPGMIPPRMEIDARLPNPAILTRNQDLPLRVLVKNKSERSRNFYLKSLHIQLIGYTQVQAHEVSHTASESWTVCSVSNMATMIGSPTDAIDTETAISPEYWTARPVPKTMLPTFATCNLARFYELDIGVGIGYGSLQRGEDQLVILSLRLPVMLYSGIARPTALLGRMSSEADPERLNILASQQAALHTPTTPVNGGFGKPGPGVPGYSASPQASAAQPTADEAPPPSYEEAIGARPGPSHGPGRNA